MLAGMTAGSKVTHISYHLEVTQAVVDRLQAHPGRVKRLVGRQVVGSAMGEAGLG